MIHVTEIIFLKGTKEDDGLKAVCQAEYAEKSLSKTLTTKATLYVEGIECSVSGRSNTLC